MLARLANLWRRAPITSASAPPPAECAPLPTFASNLSAVGLSAAEWCRRRRARVALYSTLGSAAIDRLRQRDPARVDATVAAAERVLRHEFDLLGSGAFMPRDPERRSHDDGYQPIDWHLDPVRQLRFPRAVAQREWNLAKLRPGNADVKYPWELSRCQHWPVLGQAFLMTADERFATEIARELDDFMEANPVGFGVNWTCTMDVGIRAVNWAIALEMMHQSGHLAEGFWERGYGALFDHGVFIRNNLENTYEVTSNHFLSNLLGLQFAGTVFNDLPEGAAWSAFARASIAHEMEVQVLPDGVDYESSVPYHRLVAELFLAATRLADVSGTPMPAAFQSRVRRMVTFHADVTRPDGLMPQVGDADDGRLHRLGGYALTSPQDGRHLLGPAGVMFGEPAWLAVGGDAAAWEAGWWGLGVVGAAAHVPPIPVAAKLFTHAGIAVARAGGAYLLITNGVVGTNGFGNHKHNDQLSFEYHHGGTPLVVDPGSYVYTSDPELRNLFRGTASHNTLCIDSVEQNELRPDWLFRLFESAHAETIAFTDRDEAIEYTGRHHGYVRLDGSVTHQRTLRLEKRSGALTIVDRLSGGGRHLLSWHFHFAPGAAPTVSDPRTVTLIAAGRSLTLTVPAPLEITLTPATYSPSYGVKVPCTAVDASTWVELDGDREFAFRITP